MDVVYALGTESVWNNNEIRYSLRSLEKYAIDLGRVFVVGEKPSWLTGVIYIPMTDARKGNKDANIINKVRAAIAAGVSERFIFASDDQCLISPVRLSELPAYFSEDLAKKTSDSWGKGKWWRRMKNTRDHLVSRGLPAKNFDTHVFQPHSAEWFDRVVSDAPYQTEIGFCINTLVLNSHREIRAMKLGPAKSSFCSSGWSLDRVRRDCSVSGRIHLGYNNSGLRRGLKNFLAERLSEKSRFETEGISLPISDGKVVVGNSVSLLLSEEQDALISAIPPAGRFLEIGTYHGLTASFIAQQRQDVSVFCIDPFQKLGSESRWYKNRQSNMTLLTGTVDDLAALKPAEQFDVVLIDGDHRQHGCWHDLLVCETLLRPGGTRIAHDYRRVDGTHVRGKRGVQRAVDIFCRRYRYQIDKIVGSMAFISRHD